FMLVVSDFLKAFFLIFAIVDPFASLPLFISLTLRMDEKKQKATRNTAILVAGGTLFIFALIGKYILYFLNVSLEALMIAGGILILLVGIEMVREGDKPRGKEKKREIIDIQERDGEEDVGIVPLGIPMLAGPGSISLVIVLMERMNPVIVLLATACVLVISWFFFLFAPTISLLIGKKGSKVMTRIMGLLVSGFAIQFILDGIKEWYLNNL
ncbi:MAG TPA: MarC family protein, partial [Thermoplasmata archaeon]|nr:MarC family protein [Thermoplasmata archaeon]